MIVLQECPVNVIEKNGRAVGFIFCLPVQESLPKMYAHNGIVILESIWRRYRHAIPGVTKKGLSAVTIITTSGIVLVESH